ncbi:MAG: bifunctional UDP-sugar hydrolase/5'-nucleotidase [Marinifilaceae bacterium]
MSKKILLVFSLLLLLFSACTEKKPLKMKLKVLATTDVHGAIFPYDFVKDKEAKSSLAQAFSYIRKEQEDPDQEVVLLDNGDILQGQPLVYYYNFEKTEEAHICSRVMNYMGYDAGTVGNHDIEPGHAVYDKIRKEFEFPWLGANAVCNEDGAPYFEPYTIIERRGVRIAVLGMITPAIPQWLPENIWEGMHFEPMIASARKWMKVIREKENPDLVIGLFHSGVGDGIASEGKIVEQASRLIARKVSGLDMIVCGHDHQANLIWEKNPEGKDVLVINPNNSAMLIADVEVELSWDAEQKCYKKELKPQLVPVKDLPVSEDFLVQFQSAFDEVKSYVSRDVGNFARTITTRDALFGDAAFVDLIHQIQMEITGADISFAAPLSFNAEIKAGQLQVRDLFKLYRYENLLYTMELSGQEVKDFLEYSVDLWFNQMKKESDHLLKMKELAKGVRLVEPFFNFDAAAGLNYTVDVKRGKGERIVISRMTDGTVFDLHKTYRVALNSYRGNGGGGHLTQGAGIPKKELTNRIVHSTTKDLRYYLMKWVEQQGVVIPQCDSNWKVIPKEWWQAGKSKDYQLLYGAH